MRGFWGVLAAVFFLSMSMSFAYSPDEVIVNMPDEVSLKQTFPIEIYIPADKPNTTLINIWSTNCDGPIMPLFEEKIQTNLNEENPSYYSIEGYMNGAGHLQDPLPVDCEIKFAFRYKDGQSEDIVRTLRLNPVTLTVEMPAYDWGNDQYGAKVTDDFRGTIEYNFRDPDKMAQTSDFNGVRVYNTVIKYAASELASDLKYQKMSFRDFADYRTQHFADETEKTGYSNKYLGEITPISIPGYKEAYERSVGYADYSESFKKITLFNQYDMIWAMKESGQILYLFSTYYGQYDTFEEVEAAFEENRQEMITAARTFKLSETKYAFEPLDDKYKKNVKKKEPIVEEEQEEIVEQKDIADKEFKIRFSDKGVETIWNRGRMNTGKDDDNFQILVKIDGKALDADGKTIKRITESELYEGVKLVAKIKLNEPIKPGLGEPDSQIGITGSLLTDYEMSVTSDMETIDVRGKGPRLYKSFYRPKETIDVHLEWKGKVVSDTLTYTVNIKDASPNIKIKDDSIEVQDGARRGIQYTVEDADKSKLTCYMTIPTDFAIKGGVPTSALTYKGKKTTLVKVDCKNGDTIKAVYQAPSFGNFDLNNELNALSMWKMQENTMVTLVGDVVGYSVEKRLNELKGSANTYRRIGEYTNDAHLLHDAKQLENAANTLGKANDIAVASQNAIKLTQAAKNKKDLANEFDTATGSGKQGWLEWGAEWGVFGIDVAQSTVGAIAMAPGKLPIVGPLGKKIGGKFTLVFNLMTNVWKGNFQYLAKVEKINRAKEQYFPYPVIYTVEDEDGFVTKDVQNVMIVYNWLE